MPKKGLAFPKPTPGAAVRRAKRNAKAKRHAVERQIVVERSHGQCEVWELGVRCGFRASEVHHLLGGIGRRNVGESALAKNLVAICQEHHVDVHAHRGVLRALDEDYPAGRVLFVRSGG
jgi:hypothetical protein